ncbi:PIN domain-containing protein [Sporolactobacillus nakayamae]|uniref:PIN domain-containing protein n=1 Tax=Sporolactobacillus nakayamae TaxID=269670 RepID=A0A1I2SSM6_9BACL|nr:PIN domain-containing protein [Sporolactobacillus nakayamae]SFG55680.1 hypothetical protein SAMN02982927_02035 [Sporolactobacillus nakayamae]
MIRHGCDPKWVHQTVRKFTSLMTVLPLRYEDVLKAMQAVNHYQMHYWDAQIWAVAQANGVPSLLTEDGPIEGVTYVNPLV